MKKSSHTREFLKKVYKKRKNQDGKEVGRKKNELMQVLHLQYSLPPDQRDQTLVQGCLKEMELMRKSSRFKDDFSTFAKFYKFATSDVYNFVKEDFLDLGKREEGEV